MSGFKRIERWGRMVLPLLFIIHSSLFIISCGTGDDDGRRLGEVIVGTWQCNSNDGDLFIEGETDDQSNTIEFDATFTFLDDDSYNGMVRKGTFVSTDQDGEVLYDGAYQCDNSTLKLIIGQNNIVAQVVSFSDQTLQLRYVDEDYHATIIVLFHKISD